LGGRGLAASQVVVYPVTEETERALKIPGSSESPSRGREGTLLISQKDSQKNRHANNTNEQTRVLGEKAEVYEDGGIPRISKNTHRRGKNTRREGGLG